MLFFIKTQAEYVIGYLLQNSWTLWFFRNDRNRSWSDNQCPIITFNTVEDFWALYNHIEQASKLSAGCDYSLFKVRSHVFTHASFIPFVCHTRLEAVFSFLA